MSANHHFEEEYQRLRVMANAYIQRNSGSPTLRATALVHEAYLRLSGESRNYADRKHFLCTAAAAMRQIIVDQARTRLREKRGGELQRITVEPDDLAAGETGFDVLSLQDALTRLEAWDERQARIVELRFFVGLSIEEVAETLEISERTVKRDWAMARAWLQKELAERETP